MENGSSRLLNTNIVSGVPNFRYAASCKTGVFCQALTTFLGLISMRQVGTWADSETLWRYSLEHGGRTSALVSFA